MEGKRWEPRSSKSSITKSLFQFGVLRVLVAVFFKSARSTLGLSSVPRLLTEGTASFEVYPNGHRYHEDSVFRKF